MLVGYMRVSSESDRQTTDLQLDALLAAAVDSRICSKITPPVPRTIGRA
jgi:DNA invertase Pin-like site-specific DNA recombinase